MSAELFPLDGTAGYRHRPVDLAHEPSFRLGSLAVTPAMRQVAASDGATQTVEPRVMQVLVALQRVDGGIVSRDDLIRSCWRGTIVGEDSINRTISQIRRLAEGIGRGGFRVETIPRVGYRLLLTESTEEDRPAPAPRQRWFMAASILLLLALAAAFAFWRTTPPSPVYSLSVQPFHGSDTFEDMVSSALTSRDIPTSGGTMPLTLTGSVERGGSITRVNARLITAGDQALVWSMTAQLSGTDLSRAAAMLGATAQCTLSFANDAGRALAPDILSRLARGCELMIRGDAERGLDAARQLTEQAPDFAGGWFLRSNQAIGGYFRAPREVPAVRQEAQAAAEQLLKLRPDAQDGSALLALAMAPERAVERERLLRRAATLRPIFADTAQAHLGDFLLQTGRFEEAFQLYRANAQKEPNLMARQVQLFFAAAATERWPIADEALDRIRQLDPRVMPNLLWRRALWHGDWAQAEAQVPLELPAQEQAGIATYRAMASGDAARKQTAAQLVTALPGDCCMPSRIEMLTLLGRTDQALALLDRFEASRTPGRRPGNIGLFLWDPVLRPLWFDPRIEPFLKRNGWIAYWRESKSRPDICAPARAPSFCRLLKD